MKTLAKLLLLFMSLMVIFVAGLNAETGVADQESDRIFQALDKNGDGRISRDEWNTVDSNKDGKITPEEWERYHFKSSSTIKWIDTNNDGYMDRKEFRENFRR